MPFGTKIAKRQHLSDKEWEIAKSGSRRKAIRFGLGLAVFRANIAGARIWSSGLLSKAVSFMELGGGLFCFHGSKQFKSIFVRGGCRVEKKSLPTLAQSLTGKPSWVLLGHTSMVGMRYVGRLHVTGDASRSFQLFFATVLPNSRVAEPRVARGCKSLARRAGVLQH